MKIEGLYKSIWNKYCLCRIYLHEKYLLIFTLKTEAFVLYNPIHIQHLAILDSIEAIGLLLYGQSEIVIFISKSKSLNGSCLLQQSKPSNKSMLKALVAPNTYQKKVILIFETYKKVLASTHEAYIY